MTQDDDDDDGVDSDDAATFAMSLNLTHHSFEAFEGKLLASFRAPYTYLMKLYDEIVRITMVCH